MPTFVANMRVIYIETWTVEAASIDEARTKFNDLHDDVDTDDAGGEVVDWQIENDRIKVEAEA